MSTDSEIILRARDRPAAFAELYDRHAAVVHRYVARRAGQSAAEDVTSETFLVAFERLDSYDVRRPDARPWLLGIATNLLKKHHRAEAKILKAAARAAAPETVDDDADLVTARVDAFAATGKIARTLRGMASVDRDTLLLYAWADLSYEDIAQAMNVPIGTVRSRLNRARKILKNKLSLSTLEEETENDRGRFATAP
ncbi:MULTISPECIES: RNA polymerase sigma factor [Arthrobacter]|uniref:RNA polymerase sigma factor n=2 Tax=Arthrobacter TaxID=1663 RepID=A0ABU9KJ36_9MICC|nr:RNA polymerase sigma factor [Arthrobacter sp. YJM1]MDP5226846.1 RNA polymerase sigma factor [Arthrobacter sp. YJM1]